MPENTQAIRKMELPQAPSSSDEEDGHFVPGHPNYQARLAAGALLTGALLCLVTATMSGRWARTHNASGAETAIGLSMNTATTGEAAKKFSNLAKIASGYNVYYADPAPPLDRTKDIMMDPGLRKPVFAIEYQKERITADHRHWIPDGYFATVDAGCSKSFTSKSIESSFDYSTESSRETTVSAGVSANVGLEFPDTSGDDAGGGTAGANKKAADEEATDWTPSASVGVSASAGASGSLSFTNQQSLQENTFFSQQMQRSTAKCSSYVAALDFGDMPQTHPDFQTVVDDLATNEAQIKSRRLQACDWQCYLDRYTDLQNAFGPTNVDAAATHYYNYGQNEGRNCFCPTPCRSTKLSSKHPTGDVSAGNCLNGKDTVAKCETYCATLPTCTGFWYYDSGRCCPKENWDNSFTRTVSGGGFYSCENVSPLETALGTTGTAEKAYVCASEERSTCTCNGIVYYGKKFRSGKPGAGETTTHAELKKSAFKEITSRGSVQCTHSDMGGDPLPGYSKYCYCLPTAATTDPQWWDLFDDFGTHFMMTIRMGARYSVSSYFKKSEYSSLETTVQGMGMSVGVSASAVAGVTVSAGEISKGKEAEVEAEAEAELMSPKEVEAAKEVASAIFKQDISVVGTPLTAEGLASWKKGTDETPVPIQSDRKDICLHPAIKKQGLQVRCFEAKSNYCDGRLKAKGAPCTVLDKQECQYDLDCKGDSVCRNYKCVALPVCKVTLCKDSLPGCGSTYRLPSVTANAYPQGEEFNLINANWNDEVSAVKLSEGCKKVKCFDDDRRRKQDKTFYSDTSLDNDLNDDVIKIRVWAKDPPNSRRLRLYAYENRSAPGLEELNVRLAKRAQLRALSSTSAGQASSSVTDEQKDYVKTSNVGCGYGGACSANPIQWGGGEQPYWSPNGASVEDCRSKCSAKADCAGFNYDRANNRCYYRAVPAGGVTCNFDFNRRDRDCYEKEVSLFEWPGGGATLARRANSFLWNNAASSTISKGGSRVRMDPGWAPRAASGQNYATLKIEKSCGGSEELHFSGSIGLEDGARGLSDGVTFTLSQRGKTLAALRVDFSSLAKREFDVQLSSGHAGSLIMTVDDNGNTGWDWFYVDAKFSCRFLGCPSEGSADAKYIKNIGKGLYGYNNFYGAPMSSDSAGTDPGFVHRALWQATYDQKRLACWEKFDAIPKGPPSPINRAKRVKSYTKHSNKYLSGYADGDSKERNLDASKARCDTLGADCWGVTCKTDKICTIRGGYEPKDSPSGETSYLKTFTYQTSRRLNKQSQAKRKPLLAGPRRLEKQPTLLVPDGWKVKMGISAYCEKTFDSQSIKNSYEFESESSSSSGMSLDVGVVSFGFSKEQSQFRQGNSQESKMQISTKAECIDFIMEMEDLENKPPPTSQSFQDLVKQLKSEEDFYMLFDMYGVKFPVKLVFGARYGYTRFFDEAGYTYVEENTKSTSVEAGVSVSVVEAGAASLDVSADYGLEKSEADSVSKAVNEKSLEVREVSIGARLPAKGGIHEWVKQVGEEPMPIRFELVSICEHPAFKALSSTVVASGFSTEKINGIYSEIDKADFGSASSSDVTDAGVYKNEAGWILYRDPTTKRWKIVDGVKKNQVLGSGPYDANAWTLDDCSPKEFCSKGSLKEWTTKAIDSDGIVLNTAHSCKAFEQTYCSNHIAKTSESDGASCTVSSAELTECLFDLDCEANHVCNEDKLCVPIPSCTVTVYKDSNLKGSSKTYGPYYNRDGPEGLPISVDNWEDEISSVRISGGCEEVTLVDEDDCQDTNEDNKVVDLRDTNSEKTINSLSNDLNDDVCKIWIKAKKNWDWTV